ncbi:UmuC domain-containing protein [Sulfidibacter corallicola]|uniref:UmuC domain-containing protein n=1 Tax=Sulfidibacter corallicola TaxID=2818388 RepID=A0A8A4TQQ7_SULCO|nr:hypothetical protein [Sulfidibacter corallicola]QTD51890.1 hypothetical protein J3U87_05410 [Sulfidibacter corallicola]
MTVFHLDIESFITTVERIDDPELARRPLVIAPETGRATVVAASPDAKQIGVDKGMPIQYVRRYFPDIHIKVPSPDRYRRAHREVLDLVRDFSPVVEPISYGHIAIDMSGMRRLYGNLENAALKLNRELRTRTRLPATVGLAPNKLVSTIAAKEIQKYREPLCTVDPGTEPKFLAPLTAKALPEWHERAIRKLLFELNLRRIRHIQALPLQLMGFAAGAAGLQLHRHAYGVDPRPVTPPQDHDAFAAEHCFQPDTNDDEVIQATLFQLVERLCARLRTERASTASARLALRFTDDVWRHRRFSFTRTQTERTIHQTLLESYTRWCDRRQRVRYLSLSFQATRENQQQLSLFAAPKPDALSPHLDRIRKRFGSHAIQRGRALWGQAS